MLLHVRGRDGMATPQNGAATLRTQSYVSHICQGGFLLSSLPFPSLGLRDATGLLAAAPW